MSHRNRMKKMCRDELIAIIEPPQEIEVVIEAVLSVETSSLNDIELLKIYQQGKEDYQNGKTNTN